MDLNDHGKDWDYISIGNEKSELRMALLPHDAISLSCVPFKTLNIYFSKQF